LAAGWQIRDLPQLRSHASLFAEKLFMSTANDPPGVSGAAADRVDESPAVDTRIPLAAVPPPATVSTVATGPSEARAPAISPERLQIEIGRLDWLLGALVLVFAFFLGSFTAFNSDTWMHLAAGRLIAHGDYSFGQDPFCYTTDGVRWNNHAWLYDWMSYGISQGLGGPETDLGGGILVVLKALVITALAAVLLAIRRPRTSGWISVGCVALALVAMSPRMLLQPTCWSFLFLGLTLCILVRSHDAAAAAAPSTPRSLFLLPLLFVLWVNVDQWFLLGPLTVALFLAGGVLQRMLSPTQDSFAPAVVRRLGIVLALGLVACLLSPYHIHAFTLPPELAMLVSGVPVGRDFASYIQSPFSMDHVRLLWNSQDIAGLSYFVLVAVGLASFELNREGWVWWRALVWIGFLLFSLFLTRAIPFFAVVAGPIAALNFQDYALRRFGAAPRLERGWLAWSLGGRAVCLLMGIAILAVAWPGWLHARSDDPRRSRRVAWKLGVDPSFRKTAETIAALRARGVLGAESHGFNVIPDSADYCAWFCPAEKGFYDTRLALFSGVWSELTDTREALRPGPGEAHDPAVWQKVFTDPRRRIDHVIVASPARGIPPIVQRLWNDQDQWTMLYLDGRTTIFGWHDPRKSDVPNPFRAHELDMDALAFGPPATGPSQVPEQAPEPPQKQSWWEWYRSGPAPTPLEVEEATEYLAYFERTHLLWPIFYTASQWVAPLASAIADPGAGLALPAALGFNAQFQPLPDEEGRYLGNWLVARMEERGREVGPPAPLFLAVRAARRAVAANPDDADAYLMLAQAYQKLWSMHEARLTGGQATVLEKLRQVQIVTALQHAATLRPDSLAVHQLLAGVFAQIRTEVDPPKPYLDIEVDHLEAWFQAEKAAGTRGLEPDQYQNRLREMEQFINRAKEARENAREDFEFAARNQPPLTRAFEAYKKGLIKQAIQEIQEADVTQIGRQGLDLLVRLLLTTGKLEDLQHFTPELNDWLTAQMAAATGDYQKADEHLYQFLKRSQDITAVRLTDVLRLETFPPDLRPESFNELRQLAGTFREWTDLGTIRAILALESGRNKEAAQQFHKITDLGFPTLTAAGLLAPLGTGSALETGTIYPLALVAGRGQVLQFSMRPLAYRYGQMLRAAGN
jgi:hypothetical protein